MFPKMEESALGSLLAKRVKAYFQDKEHQKEFEEWKAQRAKETEKERSV